VLGYFRVSAVEDVMIPVYRRFTQPPRLRRAGSRSL
jgi:hypothetical protein